MLCFSDGFEGGWYFRVHKVAYSLSALTPVAQSSVMVVLSCISRIKKAKRPERTAWGVCMNGMLNQDVFAAHPLAAVKQNQSLCRAPSTGQERSPHWAEERPLQPPLFKTLIRIQTLSSIFRPVKSFISWPWLYQHVRGLGGGWRETKPQWNGQKQTGQQRWITPVSWW